MNAVILLLLIISVTAVAGCSDMREAPFSRAVTPLLQHGADGSGDGGNGDTMIVGRWYQAGRGNGAKIWYEFSRDGTFTFNYDMMGNRDIIMSRGSWTSLGNSTYWLVPDVPAEPNTHGNENITISADGRSFRSGTEYSTASATPQEIVFVKS